MAPKNIAAILETKQGSIVTGERPIPKPGSGDILVRNKAVAGNPVEWMVRDYGYAITEYPTVLGSDVAGVVEAVGPDVTKFKVGDRVIGYAAVLYNSNPDHGSWQTYTLLKETNTTPLPANLSFEEGAALPMGFATAANTLFAHFGLPRPANAFSTVEIPNGNGLLIWGGGGAVAAVMIQIGRALGFAVYTTASPKHEDRLRQLGATEVFDYKDPSVVQKVLNTAKSAGLKIGHAIDCVSQKASLIATSTVLNESAGPSSKIACLLEWPKDVPCPVQKFEPVAYKMFVEHIDLAQWLFNDWLAEALAKGVVVPAPAIQIVPGGIASATAVLDAIKKGVSGVKLVVQVE